MLPLSDGRSGKAADGITSIQHRVTLQSWKSPKAQEQDARLSFLLADGVNLSIAPAFLATNAISQSPLCAAGATVSLNATVIEKIGPEPHPLLPRR